MSEIATDIINKVFAGEAPAEVTELIKSALYSNAEDLLNQKRSEVFNSVMNGEEPEETEEETIDGEENYESGEDESAESEEDE